MKVQNISIKADFESIVDIENEWCDVFGTLDEGQFILFK